MKTLPHIIRVILLFAGLAQAQVVDKKTLNLDGARQVIAAAESYAKEHGAPGGVIAVVDDGGNLMALERLDGTFAAGANISIGKARTAALFKKPTKAFEDIINKGRTAMAAMHENFTPLQGGVPILVDGQIVGAVGVSGASSAQQDEEIAMAGAGALVRPAARAATDNVRHFPAREVAAAFEKDAALASTAEYKVAASNRTGPGQAEIHTRDTDVFYIAEGRATLVTGGTVTDAQPTAEAERRGSGIEDGETRQLAQGDVVIVPAGTPHQFTKVEAPFHYFVVKSTSQITQR